MVDDQVNVFNRSKINKIEFLVILVYLFVVLDHFEVPVMAKHWPKTLRLKLVQDVSRVLAVVCSVDWPKNDRYSEFWRIRFGQRWREIGPVYLLQHT